MAGYIGRDLKIRFGGIGTAVATVDPDSHPGMMERTISRARSEVDITSDTSEGNRELLVKPGMKSMDLSVNGVMLEEEYDRLLDRVNDDTATDHVSVVIEHPDGSAGSGTDGINETGKIFINSLEITGSHSGAVSFSMSALSSGPVTKTIRT